MYFRFKIFRVTKFKRKILMRRKHLTSWLPYINIFYSWSNDYNNFKKIYKIILNLNLFKVNPVYLNTSSVIRQTIYPLNLLWNVKGSVLNKSSILNIPNTSLIFASTLKNDLNVKTNTNSFFQLAYFHAQKSFWIKPTKNLFFYFNTLIQLIFFITLIISKEFYKIFILLTLSKQIFLIK